MIWTPSRFGPPGPNLLVDMDPFSGYGPPFLNTFISKNNPNNGEYVKFISFQIPGAAYLNRKHCFYCQ